MAGARRTSMARKWIAAVAMVALVGCGGVTGAGSDDGGPAIVTFQQLLDDPGAYHGERVRLEDAGYYGAFEVSVLADAFAESYPPQVGPPERTIWVVASPPEGCLERAERVAWSTGRVVATGTFVHDPEGGFGHLGRWAIALEEATLTCG